MNTSPGHVLIVDDEKNIRRGLRAVLRKDGHTVQTAVSAEEALTVLQTFSCEVAIVDICMPGLSGTELLAQIRTHWPHTAVILLTGNGTLESAMMAVKEGAYDYLLKPAPPDLIRQTLQEALTSVRQQREQLLFLQSLRTGLQRLEGDTAVSPWPQPPVKQLTLGALQIDLQAHKVRHNNQSISLTPTEYRLLITLADRPGEAVDYQTLAQLVLDYEAELWEAKELIKRHVFSLRQKIEPDSSQPSLILNVRGVGYRTPRS